MRLTPLLPAMLGLLLIGCGPNSDDPGRASPPKPTTVHSF